MTGPRRLLIAIGVLAAITAAGSAGYVWVAGASWGDALYMTVITISTVGYSEVVPLDRNGRLFTMGLIVTSVGTALYLFTALAQLVLEGRLRELFARTAMRRRIEGMQDHVIVCGFGRFGRSVVEELHGSGLGLVVVESDPQRESELEARGHAYVLGSATADDVLDSAGVERARAIVVATGSDSDNVFITLAAREKNPRIRIHARGETEPGLRRLRQAGAQQVVSAYQLGGQRVAASLLRPSVVDFLEIAHPRSGPEIDLEEIRVGADCPLVARSLAEAERSAPRVRVVALKRGEERIQLLPDETTRIEGGDHLVVIGERESLGQLAELAGRTRA